MTKLEAANNRGDEAKAILATLVAAHKLIDKAFCRSGRDYIRAVEARDRAVEKASEWLARDTVEVRDALR